MKRATRRIPKKPGDSRLIQTLLALDPISTHYSCELSPDQALKFLSNATAYNNFTRSDLLTLVENTNILIPPMHFADGNPNNGKPHHVFVIGNEGSRVIYLQISKAYLRDWNAADFERLAAKLEQHAKDAHADEAWVIEKGEGAFVFRCWWD